MKAADLPSLTCRADMPELMDDAGCDPEALLRTVDQFASINRLVSRYRTILNRWVLDDMRREPERAWHLLDMGAGGCDIDEWLLNAARRQGLNLRVTACDVDPRIVRDAQTRRGRLPGLTIRRLDVLSDDVDEPVDYVFGNHFLHHLSAEELPGLLRRWMPRVRRRMVFSDLSRDRYSYMGFFLLSLFYRNSFAREDGLMSIRKGFRVPELYALATQSGVPERAVTVQTHCPGRLALIVALEGDPIP